MKQLYTRMKKKVRIGQLIVTDVGIGEVTFIKPPFRDGSKGVVAIKMGDTRYLMDAPYGYDWLEEDDVNKKEV
jgi:hypothetical protein